jgi:SPOR domain
MWEDEVRSPPPGYRSAPQRRAAETRRMVVAVGGVGAVLLLGVAAYFVATGGGTEGVPVIQAPPGSVKVRPDNPGGMQVNTQSSALLGSAGSAAGASLAPAPEVPDPAALAAAANQEQAPPPMATAATVPTVTAAPTASTPAVTVPAVPETPAPSTPLQAAMNVSPPSADTAAVHNLAQEYNPPARGPELGHIHVQLAALDSQEAALREWERLTHRMPELFDGRRPIFAEAHVNGHTFWRVRTAGFVSTAEATRFCDDVRARGAACTVAVF